MWCLKTIVKLNDTAVELSEQGRSVREAYPLCGIDCSDNRKIVRNFEERASHRGKVDRKSLKAG